MFWNSEIKLKPHSRMIMGGSSLLRTEFWTRSPNSFKIPYFTAFCLPLSVAHEVLSLYISMSQHSGFLYFLTSKRWANWIHQCESLKLCGHTVRITGNKFILMLCNKGNEWLNNTTTHFFLPCWTQTTIHREICQNYQERWSCCMLPDGARCAHRSTKETCASTSSSKTS